MPATALTMTDSSMTDAVGRSAAAPPGAIVPS